MASSSATIPIDNLPKSSVLTPEDFSEKHEWGLDKVGGFKRIQETMVNIYEDIMQVVQNAYDSPINPTSDPNIIVITVPSPTEPNPTNIVLKVEDHGQLGLTKDFGGQIHDFIEAQKQKAISTKAEQKGTGGHKGLGMIQYPRIGTSILFYSEDDTLLYRIPMFPTNGYVPCFGKYKYLAKTDENRKLWNITHRGTRVEFYDRPLKSQAIEVPKLREKTAECFGLQLARNGKLSIIINNEKLQVPDYMKEHPEKPLFSVDNGQIKVSGNIWYDKNGMGSTKVYIDGTLAGEICPSARRCKAWIAIDEPDRTAKERKIRMDTGRGRIIYNHYWELVESQIVNLMRPFQLIEDNQDRMSGNTEKNLKTLLGKGLAKMFQKKPTAFGGQNARTKTEQTGDRHGNDTPGYPVPKEKTIEELIKEKDKKKQTKRQHKRNNANQRMVGTIGEDNVMRGSDTTSTRHEYDQLTLKEAHQGTRIRYLSTFQDIGENIAVINKDRPLYPKVAKELHNTVTRAGAYLIAPAMANERLLKYINENQNAVLEIDEIILMSEDLQRDCLTDMGFW